MTGLTTIRVDSSRPYDVIIGEGILDNAGKKIADVKNPCKAAIITDSTVRELYADRLAFSLQSAGFDTCLFSFESGEASKNIDTLSDALEFLASRKMTRSDIIIALGGGVVGDLAGFAAAVYLRGIDFVQIPTTLLAAVDSSVGGKTAIDLKNGKNLAGCFYSPVLVLCDCKTLDTLPDEMLSDGTAEALKYGVLFDGELFGKIASGKVAGDRESIIARCVDLKRMVVETDEFDRGARQLLNFGHTIGHAIEKCSGFTISHGRGVAVGMAMIAKAAAQKGISEYDCAPRIISALNNCRLPHKTDYTAKQLFEAALLDKKRQSGSITLVLPRRIGECFLKKIPVEELIEYIEAGI